MTNLARSLYCGPFSIDGPTQYIAYTADTEDNQRPYRLEAQSCNFQQDQSHLQALLGGLVCVHIDLCVACLFQLVTRPTGRSNGHVSAKLGTTLKRFANPPWCIIRRVLSCNGSENPESPGGFGWERPAMVPSSPENALELFLADSSTPQPDPEPNRTGVNSPASCVAYLQKKFNNSSLSEEAARLLLAS